MTRTSSLAAALAAAAILSGCSGSEDPRDTLTACLYDGSCNEYEGPDLNVPATDASCADTGGTALDTCPTDGVLGLCTRQRDTTTIRDYHYDAATLDMVRDACIMIGDSWSTP